jgi:phosphatidylglycerophosphate synthase
MDQSTPQYSYAASVKSDISDELINVHLQRPIAGIVVRAVYHTSVTPNQLTIVSTLLGIAGGIFLAVEETHFAAAALCFYLKDIFDSADGQLARAKKLYSRRGRFLDSIGDYIVDLFLFGGICEVLLGSGITFFPAFMVSLIGFLGISLRVSYHVFYQSSFLHQKKEYGLNRLSEELRDSDLRGDAVTVRLQRMFYLLYGWQDRLMKRLDAWCMRSGTRKNDPALKAWYEDATGLRLGGFLGFGTEYVLLTACLLLNDVRLYLFVSLILLNAVWLSAILYRKIILSKRVSAG